MTDTLTIDRPITGDINHYGNRTMAEQVTSTEFLADLDAVLAIEGIEALRWEQYTPYFNDGDACEFGINEVTVLVTGADPDGDDNEYSDGFNDLFTLTYKNNEGEYPYRPEGLEISEEATAVIKSFAAKFDSYENVIRASFGDPAEVTATAEGFAVEYYEHH